MDSVYSQLLDFVSLGLFDGFLIYSNAKMQKRLDETVARFQETLENQEKAHAAAEDIIRTRYDNLLAQFNTERQRVYDDVVKKLDDIVRAVSKE